MTSTSDLFSQLRRIKKKNFYILSRFTSLSFAYFKIIYNLINANETKGFKRFVRNRVSFIRAHSNLDDWNYVPCKLNIADIGSKDVSVIVNVGDLGAFLFITFKHNAKNSVYFLVCLFP